MRCGSARQEGRLPEAEIYQLFPLAGQQVLYRRRAGLLSANMQYRAPFLCFHQYQQNFLYKN